MVDPDRMMILSLKPRYAEVILSGSKTVELRRTEPRIRVPTRALIYATTPVKALVGTCIVESVMTDGLAVLWEAYGSCSGLRHGEFRSYFEGRDVGSALVLSEACRFARQVALADLRASRCMDRPPQSYAYIDATAGDQLLRLAA
jgi:predicted transcriptional regulator